MKKYLFLAKRGKTEVDKIFLKIKNIIQPVCFQEVMIMIFQENILEAMHDIWLILRRTPCMFGCHVGMEIGE